MKNIIMTKKLPKRAFCFWQNCLALLAVLLLANSAAYAQKLEVWLDDDYAGPTYKGTYAEPCTSLTQIFQTTGGGTAIIPNYHLYDIDIKIKPGNYDPGAAKNLDLALFFAFNGNTPTGRTYRFIGVDGSGNDQVDPNLGTRLENNSASEAIVAGGAAAIFTTLGTAAATGNTFVCKGLSFKTTTQRIFGLTATPASTTLRLENNIFWGNLAAANSPLNQLTDVTNVEVLNNKFLTSTGSDIGVALFVEATLAGRATSVKIENNYFIGQAATAINRCIVTHRCTTLSVRNNTIINCTPTTAVNAAAFGSLSTDVASTGAAIYCKGDGSASPATTSVTIEQNTFTNVLTGCIFARDYSNATIQNNQIANCQGILIKVEDEKNQQQHQRCNHHH